MHQSPGTTDTPSLAPPRPLARSRDAAFRREWGRVRVEHVAVHPEADGSGRLVATACVFLGHLLPADVAVTMRCEGNHADQPRRMTSARSYENGCHLFEAPVPPDEFARVRSCCVSVSPDRAALAQAAPPPVSLATTREQLRRDDAPACVAGTRRRSRRTRIHHEGSRPM